MAKKKTEVLQDYIDETDEFIGMDRSHGYLLLESILNQIRNGTGREDVFVHKELGMVAAKYLESIQRSTEQKVKLAAIIHRKDMKTDQAMSDKDKDDLYDMIDKEKGKDD